MKPVIKKADGTVVEMKDVQPGEKVALSIPRPARPQPMMRAMGMMAQPEGREAEPPVEEDSIDLGTFTLNKAASKTPEEVHAAGTLTPEQLQARIDKWREKHPDRSTQHNERQAAFIRSVRGS